MHRIGLISDTHGLLRPEAVAFLQGCERIIHGGDVGDATVLDMLADIAPVVAVRGNNDRGPWAAALPDDARLQIDDVRIYAIHDLAQMSIDPASAGIRVVVSGHSHKPSIADNNDVLYVNPGSAGTASVQFADLCRRARHRWRAGRRAARQPSSLIRALAAALDSDFLTHPVKDRRMEFCMPLFKMH